MTKRKAHNVGGSLTAVRKSSLAHRSTVLYPEEYDTRLQTQRMLMERGYIKPGDSQYDKALLPKKVPAPKQET